MPISYTKRGWTNNSPPAINAANLGAMDDALKLTADTVDAATATPAANAIPKADGSGKLDSWISDANTGVKGKALLGASGGATKLTTMPDGGVELGSALSISSTSGYVVEGSSPSTLSIVNNCLRTTWSGEGANRVSFPLAGVSGKTAFVLIRGSRAGMVVQGYSYINSTAYGTFTLDTKFTIVKFVLPISTSPSLKCGIYQATVNCISGDYFDIAAWWIGDPDATTREFYLSGSLSTEAARIADQLGDTAGAGVAARATITSNGTNVSNDDMVTLAGKVYTFKTALTPAEGEVLIGETYTDSLDNLVAAITGGAGNGTLYSCAAAHPLVTASRNGAVVTITALQAGILGNQITTAKSAATLTLANLAGGTSTLAGGVDDWGAKAKFQLGSALGAGAQVGALPNRTNSNIIGYYDVVDCAAGAQVTLPAGGTWAWMVETYGATYNGVKCGTAAGGAAITGTASANLVMYYERIA